MYLFILTSPPVAVVTMLRYITIFSVLVQRTEIVAIGTATVSTSTTTKVTLGFKPKYLAVRETNASEAVYFLNVYDERYSTSAVQVAGTSAYLQHISLGGGNVNRITAINNDGFTINKSGSSSYTKIEYFAIG